jgi:Mn2+/Fe2+ NRAMP family transporter
MPSITFSAEYFELVVALLGTTISPYLFFWQAGQEVEELRSRSDRRLRDADDAEAKAQLSRINTDTLVGMAFSNIIAYFIIVTAAATLHAHGISDIKSADQAAQALRPIAGDFAFACFALGIIGTGLLAVPVLAGSAAYAVSEMMDWRGSLEDEPREAVGFYLIVTVATVAGAGLGSTTLNPIQLLIWSAVINGFVAVPLMCALMFAAGSENLLGRHALKGGLKILGWLATAVMAAATSVLVWSWLR